MPIVCCQGDGPVRGDEIACASRLSEGRPQRCPPLTAPYELRRSTKKIVREDNTAPAGRPNSTGAAGYARLVATRFGAPPAYGELVALLDRQHDYLRRQQGATYIRQLVRSVENLLKEPRLEILLSEIAREGETVLESFLQRERELVAQFASLRDELLERIETPAEGIFGLVVVDREIATGAAAFDTLAAQDGRDVLAVVAGAVAARPSVPEQLGSILRQAIVAVQYGSARDPGLLTSRTNTRPDLDELSAGSGTSVGACRSRTATATSG